MRQFAAIAFLALCLIACTPRARTLPALPPLTDEGELFVYLDAVPDDSARLALSFGAVAASRSDGVDEPLELQLVELTAKDAPRQRLFAMGRVPPGSFAAPRCSPTRARRISSSRRNRSGSTSACRSPAAGAAW